MLAYATLDLNLDLQQAVERAGELDCNLGAPFGFVATGPAWNGSLDGPSFRQAMSGPDADKWLAAMHAELESFRALETWDADVVDLPPGRRAVGVKWVLLIKRDADGRVIKYKARLVARGDQQVDGVDYDETHSSTARLASVRLIFAILARNPSWRLLQFDVASAYLHGNLDRPIYVQQPQGFVDKSNPRGVRRLRKALYGL
ncbi:hypothetical protein JCM3774_003584 [Rhodotorula dairenensis]